VQVYIYIYSLHLAPKLKHLYSEICVIKKCVVSLNPWDRQTNSGQSRTNKPCKNRYCFVTYLKFWKLKDRLVGG